MRKSGKRRCSFCCSHTLLRTVMLSLFFSFSFGSIVSAKEILNQQVHIRMGEAPVQKVFKELERQTNVYFMYSEGELACNQTVSLNTGKTHLKDALNEICRQVPLKYEVVEDYVLVKKRDLPLHAPAPVNFNVQQHEVKGKVTDEKGSPLPGVSIMVKGTSVGITSDINGNYKIKVPANAKIIKFSFLGMEPQEVTVGGKSSINIVLKSVKTDLNEVVVTGFQEINKKKFTGAGSVVAMNALGESPLVSVDNILQNKVAGVNIQMGGTTGQANIRIRGTSSINGLQVPLWVIDGVIMESPVFRDPSQINYSDPNSLYNSGIDGLAPTDIASITILKDASATAIYGTRASNGVIVVKTKEGKAGALKVNFNASSSLAQRFDIDDFNRMNSSERLQLDREMLQSPYVDAGVDQAYDSEFFRALKDYKNGSISLLDYKKKIYEIEQYNTDWVDVLYRNALSYQANISASGGTQAVSYYASIGYSDNQDNLKNKGYNRINALMKGTFRIGDRLMLEAKLITNQRKKFGYSGSIGVFQNPFMLGAGANRTYRAYNDNGAPMFYNVVRNVTDKIPFSAVDELSNMKDEFYAREMGGQLDFRLNFDKIIISGISSYNFTSSLYNFIVNPNTYYIENMKGIKNGDGTYQENVIPRGGVYSNQNNYTKTYYFRGMMELVPFNASSIHDLHISAGSEIRNSNYDAYSTYGMGYMPDRAGKMQTVVEAFQSNRYNTGLQLSKQETPFLSYFGILDYTLNQKYTIKATGRMDGSNLFGDRNQFVPLWSVGVNWLISGEDFLKKVKAIDRMNIRASYGYQGNVAPNFIPDLQLSVGDFNKFKEEMKLNIQSLENPNLRWEVTKTWNAGLDLSMLNYRLGFTLDVYSKKSEDLLSAKPVSAVNGIYNAYVNWADISNKGFELGVNGTPIKSDNFEWRLNANFSYNKNEVLSSKNQNKAWSFVGRSPSSGKAMEGYPLNSLFSYRFAGINKDGLAEYFTGQFDENGKEKTSTSMVSDFNALEYSGSLDNPYSGGFNTSLLFFKRLTFSMDLSFEAGGVRRVMPIMESFSNRMYPSSWENVSREFINRWQKPGDEAFAYVPRFMSQKEFMSSVSGFVNPSLLFDNSNIRVAKADYLKLRNVSLSYSFAPKLLDKLRLTQMGLGFQVQNVFTLKDKKLKGLDPQNFYLSEPLPRTYTLSLNLSF